ncbi:GDP-mannose 4,6-dehydratase [Candidatus Curtissbacteria bacterium]|nr:GDP-mannose 4,6-dehydratase [Candidatus Curtissbacteria bacterium]
MKKALITGITGFAGSHLAELLLKEKLAVWGFHHPKHPTANIARIQNHLKLLPCDLLKEKEVTKSVKIIKPDFIFHLAAAASAAQSFKDPSAILQNNIEAQINLLEAVAKYTPDARVLVIGSSEEYGEVEDTSRPVTEGTALKPHSPYAISKVVQDLLGYQYYLNRKLKIVRVRPFNHIGPRQAPDFVVPSFASQIAIIEKKGKGKIKVGNLGSWRDFTDVRDMVKAYFLALSGKCSYGDVYNIGSGKAVQIKEILQKLISLSSAKIKVVVGKSRFRPVDTRKIICDYSKFTRATAWKPIIKLDQTLSDTIDYERKRLQAN